jgi:starch phosphorylase
VIDTYPVYNYEFLKDTGVMVSVTIRKREVKCKVWLCDTFGNAPIYLLDTDVPGNEDSWITGQLYGWFGEERIAQVMVLGIGGVKALRALGIATDVYHFNEGHALFAGFELVREKLAAGMDYDAALAATRKEIVFTTHTPVVQGNESHYIDRLLYMGADNGSFNKKQLKALGGGWRCGGWRPCLTTPYSCRTTRFRGILLLSTREEVGQDGQRPSEDPRGDRGRWVRGRDLQEGSPAGLHP